MKLGRILCGIAAVGLTITALSVPAIADESNEPPRVRIAESDYGFEFIDDRSGEPITEIRSLGEGYGNGVSLGATSDELPVILHTMAALEDSVDFDTEYDAAVEFANTEREIAAVDDPDATGTYSELEIASDEATYDPSDLRPRAAYAVTANSVTFYLTHAQSYDDTIYNFYGVWIDQKLVEVHESPVFSVSGLEPNSEYYFEIVASDEDPLIEVTEGSEILANTRTILVATPDASLERTISSPVATLSWTPSVHGYMHTTYIEPALVTLDPPGSAACGAWSWEVLQFGGDNRYYQTPNFSHPGMGGMPTHRTWMMAEAVWAINMFTAHKNVAPTKKYINGILVGTDTASDSGMQFLSPSIGGGYAQIILDHEVTNPWCAVGAITYIDQVRFYQTADTVEVVGWRLPVPNHEISFKYSLNAPPGYYWLPALWRGTMSFDCLLGYCPKDNYTQTIAGV